MGRGGGGEMKFYTCRVGFVMPFICDANNGCQASRGRCPSMITYVLLIRLKDRKWMPGIS